jgi:hypothetical protein
LFFSVSQFEFGGTDTSGGVEGYPGTGTEYGYEAQYITGNLLFDDDSHIFSLRYYDGSTVDRTGIGLNSRFIWQRKWRVQPRLWVEYRKYDTDGTHQWQVRPSMRLIYTPVPRHYFELEIGREWSLRDIALYGEENMNSDYLIFNYRYDFY